jgi:hypothetical protein
LKQASATRKVRYGNLRNSDWFGPAAPCLEWTGSLASHIYERWMLVNP